TGGTPASADAAGIAGYVNQVVKTGTYPGYADVDLGFGDPAFYNDLKFEAGGATPDRRLTYYVGQEVSGEGYRYGDQYNGVSNPLFFFPEYIPSHNGDSVDGACLVAPCVFDGSGTPIFAPGATYAISNTLDTETMANIHIAIPHHNGSGKDDIQFLYNYSNLLQDFYSSLDDLGVALPNEIGIINGGNPYTYFDQFAYNGPVFQPPNPNLISTALFPNTGTLRPPDQDIPLDEREGNQNGMALAKLQFQKNINTKSYLRIFGYSDYSWWFITGPVSADLTYGDQLPDYEVIGHTYGTDAVYSNQLSDKHLINATISYYTSKLQTYSEGFQTGNFTNLIDSAGNCYTPFNGNLTSCFNPTDVLGNQTQGTAQDLEPGTPPAGSPAALANAQWIVTENGQNAQVDNVKPDFSALSFSDQWRPNDKLTFTLGARVENFRYVLQNLENGYPARQFWFNAFNREYCFGLGYPSAIQRQFDPSDDGVLGPCPAGTQPTDLQNFAGGTISETVPQPRLGATWELNNNSVIRASYGRYARPAPTSYQEYNTFQQDLPSFISTFLNSGWDTPEHIIHADTSDNADVSFEHHFVGTNLAMKLTPFYRTTQGQVQYVSLNAQGVVAGVNAGNQRSDGIEFELSDGSFDRNGLAAQVSATYTRSRVTYGDFPNGLNVIDQINEYIQQYNSYTSACANAEPSSNPTSLCGVWGNTNATADSSTGVANPYFGNKAQPLLGRSAAYTTYDQIPAPFNNAIGFETPFQGTLVLNFKHNDLTISPNFVFSTQGNYGSPLVWPGYDPQTCTLPEGSPVGSAANPQNCSGYIFIPDKYTGVFDNLGSFPQPSRLTANMSIGYTWSPRLSTTLTFANIIDHCYQRGYPWDSWSTCEYAQLASNLLPPAGNFVANPPVQLAYPYGSWYNNEEVAQIGQRNPMEAVLDFSYKL
ncbi:MAG TPA: TonB-dependent receptor, partial [Candidatus Eremiobacteraceae bacterium]|nr:TonB-dependent receptor [Candidatus Eremiobacteraceae bacterium]